MILATLLLERLRVHAHGRRTRVHDKQGVLLYDDATVVSVEKDQNQVDQQNQRSAQ